MKKHKFACSEMQIAHWIIIGSNRTVHYTSGSLAMSPSRPMTFFAMLAPVSSLNNANHKVMSLYTGIRWNAKLVKQSKTSPSSDVSTWLKVLAACRPTFCERQWPDKILTNSNESYRFHHAIDFRKPSIVSCSLTFIFSHYFIIHPISYWIWAPPKVAG